MSTNTTKIDVLLKNPNGWPLTNVCFGVKPVRTGFMDSDVPIVEDKEFIYKTDKDGYAQMELLPLPFPYVLTYSESDDEIPGYFMFYVPEIGTTVQLKDLVVTKANEQDKYGEYILKQIVAAKAEVQALVNSASGIEAAAAKSAKDAANSALDSEASAQSMAGARDQVLQTQLALQTVLQSINEAIVKIQAINLQNKLVLGGHTLWIDSSGILRVVNGVPTDLDKDGYIVGDQTSGHKYP